MQYTGQTSYSHSTPEKNGVLLINLGSPDNPDTASVRRYLAEFLWDPRIVEVPRLLWWLVLHGIILRFRPARSARKYASIWQEHGSPLTQITADQTRALGKLVKANPLGPNSPELVVEYAMRYGNPSIEHVITRMLEDGVSRLLIVPLYPQYSATTTASVFDRVVDVLKKFRRLPELRFLTHYHDHPDYIDACADRIRESFKHDGKPDTLLFSYHGIPERYFKAGDPYFCECHKTSRLIAEKLALPEGTWKTTFQSRFGREPWLQPYTDETLKNLGKQVEAVSVFCPGFAADCLETLEEIDDENREIFLEAGGKRFVYIPALNTESAHIRALDALIRRNLTGWDTLRQASAEQFDAMRSTARDPIVP
ncbi:MAG: ferrochelatase [Hahellaceae bacterium]|jgi:ferrochelatase|nr:ferrochelatase [Hahellaceae bacterium]